MKPTVKLFVTVALLFIALLSKAQKDSLRGRKPDSLYYKNSFFKIYPVVVNNGKQLSKDEAALLFNKVPAASSVYKKYRNKYKVGLYSLAGVFGFSAVSSIALDKGNRALTASGLTLSFYSFVNSVIFFSIGDAKLKKAIRLYNHSSLK